MEENNLDKKPKKYIAEFAYSGCGKREFFTREFEGENILEQINKYVKRQNVGEAKSDRIRFVKVSKLTTSPE